MTGRLKILDQHGFTLADIQAVIDAMGPLEGAAEFVAWLRERTQVIILSDTFYEFALPLMRQLGYPTIFCNQLEIGPNGRIVSYKLRQPNQKKQAVAALKNLNFRVIAAGDAYNDTAMLGEGTRRILLLPARSSAEGVSAVPGDENLRGVTSALRTGREFQIAFGFE